MNSFLKRACCAILTLWILDARSAADAEWPVKPITLVVPGGTGGVVDIRARWLAQHLSPLLGQPVIIDNRPGAGGATGTASVAKSAPDGYTLVMVHQGTLAVTPHLVANVGYSPLKDFVPITRVGHGGLVLVVHPSLPVHNVAEFIDYLKKKNGAANYGSPGVGTPPHVAVEFFKLQTGTKAQHIPYKGGGQAASDLMGGHVDFSIEGLTVMVPLIKDGRVRALAVTSDRRIDLLPEVPTMREAGVRDYSYEGWIGIAAPAGTPPPIIARVYEAARQVMLGSEGREFFAAAGTEVEAEAPEVFAAIVRAEYEKWGRVVREAGLKAE